MSNQQLGYPFTNSSFSEPTKVIAKSTRPSPLDQRRVDHKIFGHIPGAPVGSTWGKRIECHNSGVHAGGVMRGISGCQDQGAYSVALSGGYEDDIDLGDTFTYTGSGGRDKSLRVGPQVSDQSFLHPPNKALKISAATGRPVRVIRSFNLESPYAPPEGYRYDGLYTVVKAWLAKGKSGFAMCKYEFRRVPGQPPLPLCGVKPVVTSNPVVKSNPVITSNPAGTSNPVVTPTPMVAPRPAVKSQLMRKVIRQHQNRRSWPK